MRVTLDILRPEQAASLLQFLASLDFVRVEYPKTEDKVPSFEELLLHGPKADSDEITPTREWIHKRNDDLPR
jgi:hypothetical protein